MMRVPAIGTNLRMGFDRRSLERYTFEPLYHTIGVGEGGLI